MNNLKIKIQESRQLLQEKFDLLDNNKVRVDKNCRKILAQWNLSDLVENIH